MSRIAATAQNQQWFNKYTSILIITSMAKFQSFIISRYFSKSQIDSTRKQVFALCSAISPCPFYSLSFIYVTSLAWTHWLISASTGLSQTSMLLFIKGCVSPAGPRSLYIALPACWKTWWKMGKDKQLAIEWRHPLAKGDQAYGHIAMGADSKQGDCGEIKLQGLGCSAIESIIIKSTKSHLLLPGQHTTPCNTHSSTNNFISLGWNTISNAH